MAKKNETSQWVSFFEWNELKIAAMPAEALRIHTDGDGFAFGVGFESFFTEFASLTAHFETTEGGGSVSMDS